MTRIELSGKEGLASFGESERGKQALEKRLRVLYSFPNPLGGPRIGYTAWQQVRGLAEAGVDLTVCSASVRRPVPPTVRLWRTLSRGGFRIPFRLIGRMRAMALHDRIVARRVRKLAGKIDLIHTWPIGALQTLKAAAELHIPTVLERPNAHTRFAYEAVRGECERLGVTLPKTDSHSYQPYVLRVEEEEYRLATRLLCPSEFAARTFLDKGFAPSQISRHIYGYDENTYYPAERSADTAGRFTMLFVGVCAVRKGLHLALDAWLRSPAHLNGIFLIAGDFLPAYREKLAAQLAHPSVKVLGHRNDVPELMRNSDVLVLPSIEEGFGLVCTEAMGSGCVPLVSEACTEICEHMKNALIHRIGDVETLTQHITCVHQNRSLLRKLRAAGLRTAPTITWSEAAKTLLGIYRQVVSEKAIRPT
jgi:glycosyltransferase involved in cell wall biosynthesis